MEIWSHELLFPSIHPIYMSVYFLSRRNCLILKLQSESTEAGFHSEETWSILCSGLRNKAMGSKGNRPSHPVTFVFLLVNSILARKMVNCEEELPKPNRCQPTGYQQVTDSFLRQEVCCWIDRKRVLYWQMVSKTRKQILWFSTALSADCCFGLWPKPTVVRQTAYSFFWSCNLRNFGKIPMGLELACTCSCKSF